MSEGQSLAEPRRRIDIMVIHDGNMLAVQLAKLLVKHFRVGQIKLDGNNALLPAVPKVMLFCFNQISPQQIQGIRRVAGNIPAPPLFAFPTYNKGNVDVAQNFAGSEYFITPIDRQAIVNSMRAALERGINAAWSTLRQSEQKALKSSAAGFDACFSAMARGERMPIGKVYSACEDIQATLGHSTVDTWLDALQQHHDSSFRHSMLVCGALAFFGHDIGIRGEDLQKITVGTFLHDAGKAQIPLSILDKPGKLDADEFRIIQQHPVLSRKILSRQEDLHPDVIAMAASHHEKLDGTGYPDGLSGGQISDIVRLTAISDVYSALVEERSYKRGMSNEKAFDIMLKLDHHLDMGLVTKFQEYILDTFMSNAA